jgi:hypothetical protein
MKLYKAKGRSRSELIREALRSDEDLLKEARALLAEVEARRLEAYVPALLLYEVGKAAPAPVAQPAGTAEGIGVPFCSLPADVRESHNA